MFRRKKDQIVVHTFKGGLRRVKRKYTKDVREMARQGYVVESQGNLEGINGLLVKQDMMVVTYRLRETAKG